MLSPKIQLANLTMVRVREMKISLFALALPKIALSVVVERNNIMLLMVLLWIAKLVTEQARLREILDTKRFHPNEVFKMSKKDKG